MSESETEAQPVPPERLESAGGASRKRAAPASRSAKGDASSAAPPPAPGALAVPRSANSSGEHDALLNTMLGEFRLLRRLGRGGMAEVYLAEQTSLKRQVAIKILRKELVSDETYVVRFKTEAMAAGGLSHPNIVQVYLIGEGDGIQYIAQEYVQGMNLREFLTRKGPPDLPLLIHIMKQVAGALQAAGNAGIVHRDIKPENILMTRKGEVKVADFGLAQLTQKGERLNLTMVGVTMGTPLYMSPEQVSGSKLDSRSDLYSFGVTCFHMLAGHPPFRGETALTVALQHLKEEPPRLQELRPDVPPLLCEIIHKMMAKDLEQRYPNAQAVLKDLKRVATQARGAAAGAPNAGQLTGSAESLMTQRPWSQRLRGTRALLDLPWPRQAFLLVLASLVVAVIAAGVGWLSRPANPFQRAVSISRPKATALRRFERRAVPILQTVANDEPRAETVGSGRSAGVAPWADSQPACQGWTSGSVCGDGERGCT